jgi:hypothetical protein
LKNPENSGGRGSPSAAFETLPDAEALRTGRSELTSQTPTDGHEMLDESAKSPPKFFVGAQSKNLRRRSMSIGLASIAAREMTTPKDREQLNQSKARLTHTEGGNFETLLKEILYGQRKIAEQIHGLQKRQDACMWRLDKLSADMKSSRTSNIGSGPSGEF